MRWGIGSVQCNIQSKGRVEYSEGPERIHHHIGTVLIYLSGYVSLSHWPASVRCGGDLTRSFYSVFGSCTHESWTPACFMLRSDKPAEFQAELQVFFSPCHMKINPGPLFFQQFVQISDLELL